MAHLRPLARTLAGTVALASVASVLVSLTGCPSTGPSSGGVSPVWPKSSKLVPTPLPSTVNWKGVYFISTSGSRGALHMLPGADNRVHGCWLAEDHHARATFVGTVRDNIAMLDWTQKRVGFAGAPERVTAYLVLTPGDAGKDSVKGEYGSDLSDDGGSPWEGVRQRAQEPKEDGCRLDEGDTSPAGTKGFQ